MRILRFLLFMNWLVLGCQEPTNRSSTVSQDTAQYTPIQSFGGNEKEMAGETNCEFENGSHPATVDYYNPKTGHTAKYELNVHVKDCKVIQIDFPNGGWLDEDHIPQTKINENREAVVKDDKGRQWKIHLH